MPTSADSSRYKSENNLKWYVEEQIDTAVEKGAFRVDIHMTKEQNDQIRPALIELGYRVAHNGYEMRVCW